MTITEFLLARIAEDEEWSREWRDDYSQTANRYPILVSPARVLAECAAKRAIVGHCASGLAYGGFGESTLAEVTLRALAAVYAEHGDYDPTWAIR